MLGGTFDPIHVGHLAVARAARRGLALDRVLLVPANVPPHKPAGPMLAGEVRAELIARAVADEPHLELSRLELDRPGPSYTVDTLRRVHAAHPDADLWFVMGADQLRAFDTWREPAGIVALARLAVVPRPGADAAPLAARADRVSAGRVDRVACPEVEVSSSDVRARMAAGESIDGLVPEVVATRLRRMGLVPSARSGGTSEEAWSHRSI